MLYLIRHGQTAKNQEMVLQGRTNHPLNENGIEQARKAGEWFREKGIRFSRIYSSPLGRAIKTAYIVSGSEKEEGSCDITVDDRLVEMDYGPYEGMSLKDPAPEIITFFSDFKNNPAPEGMEALSSVVQRAGDFLEEIREIAAFENVLVSTHAITMKGLLEYLTPESDGAYWSKYIANCAIYLSEVKDGSYTVPVELTGELPEE